MWTAEQAKAIASKGGKAKEANRQAREAALANQNKELFRAIANPPTDTSPETALELSIARMVHDGSRRPATIDKLTIALARLRKSSGTRRREVQASPLSSHNNNYTSIGSVVSQPLTQEPNEPLSSTTRPSGVAQEKESLLASQPPAGVGVGAAAGGPGESVNTLSTSTPSQVSGWLVGDSAHQVEVPESAPWAELVGGGRIGLAAKPELAEADPKAVPCPGPGWEKVKVGGHWVWGKKNQ